MDEIDPDALREDQVARGAARAAGAEAAERAALRDKYAATIRRLWRRQDECLVCGSNLWNIGDLVQTPIRDIGGAREAILAQLGAKEPSIPLVYVYVPVTCLVCGFTMFFHTGTLDVRDQEEVKTVPPVRRSPE